MCTGLLPHQLVPFCHSPAQAIGLTVTKGSTDHWLMDGSPDTLFHQPDKMHVVSFFRTLCSLLCHLRWHCLLPLSTTCAYFQSAFIFLPPSYLRDFQKVRTLLEILEWIYVPPVCWNLVCWYKINWVERRKSIRSVRKGWPYGDNLNSSPWVDSFNSDSVLYSNNSYMKIDDHKATVINFCLNTR